jgi:hypothetical protein
MEALQSQKGIVFIVTITIISRAGTLQEFIRKAY